MLEPGDKAPDFSAPDQIIVVFVIDFPATKKKGLQVGKPIALFYSTQLTQTFLGQNSE
jgi:hypothetical protein